MTRMTHEPSAVLTAYALSRGGASAPPANAVVIDFGAGSLQVTVASIEDGVVDTKSVYGTPSVGGDIIDLRLLDHLMTKFTRSSGIGQLANLLPFSFLVLPSEPLFPSLSQTSEEIHPLFADSEQPASERNANSHPSSRSKSTSTTSAAGPISK